MSNFGDVFRFLFGETRDSPYNEPFSRDCPHGEYGCEDNGNVDSIFFHFQSDMQQHMEEMQQQMEDMMKNFGAVEFSNVPHIQFPTTGPSSSGSSGNLRDDMLKSPNAPPVKSQLPSEPPAIIRPSPGQQDRSFFGAFGLPRLRPIFDPPDEPKVDRDLDGKEAEVLKDLGNSRCTECPVPKDTPSNSFFSGHSVTVRSVQGPDGKMEQWRTVQDTSGRKEETCTRYVDGKMHTVTRKIDDKGNEEKIEEFKNMDESDLSAFNKTWNTPEIDASPSEHPANIMTIPQQPRSDSYLGNIFSKLFGFRP